MRPIKFRAWDVENKVMIPWSSGFFSDQSPVTGYGDDFPEDDEHMILLQFTGLLDKNGKEIYEGDLLRCPKEQDLLEVQWCNVLYFGGDGGSHPGFYFNCAHYDAARDLEYNLAFHDQLEVVGNVYEHSHLVRPKKGS